jgi:chitinase
MAAAAPAFACGADESNPADGRTPLGQAGSAAIGGASASTLAGTGPTVAGGTENAVSGAASLAGSGNAQAGTPSTGGGAGGGTTVEVCSYPAWQAGQDYAAGDKVMYMGKAFVANEQNPGYDPLVSTYFWSPYDCQPAGGGGSGAGGSGPGMNVGECVLDELLPHGEATFHAMFIPPWQGHEEKTLYSYSALCTALEGFREFASSGNAEQDKREVAAFFAHVAKETAFLEQTDEAGQPSSSGDFHGRGAIQLTGHSNYQAAGDYLKKNLVGNPGLVSTDPITNWQTALWFWSVHHNPGTPGVKNCHQAISAGDFGQTTRIINGGIECPGSESAATRAEYFKTNCRLLDVSPGTSLVC